MKPFSEAGSQLTWIRQSSDGRVYELRSGEDQVAVLRWEKPAGSLAQAETTEGKWTFKRIGFLQPRLSVRSAGSEQDLAWFEPGVGGGGAVHLASGHIFRWSSNFWRAEWAWLNAAGKHGVKLHREFSAGEREGKVEIERGVLPERELPILVILGWYVIILQTEDSAILPSS